MGCIWNVKIHQQPIAPSHLRRLKEAAIKTKDSSKPGFEESLRSESDCIRSQHASGNPESAAADVRVTCLAACPILFTFFFGLAFRLALSGAFGFAARLALGFAADGLANWFAADDVARGVAATSAAATTTGIRFRHHGSCEHHQGCNASQHFHAHSHNNLPCLKRPSKRPPNYSA